MSSILGRGLGFPLRVGTDGRFVWSDGEANIRESIAIVLKTEPGERLGLPDFGAGLGRYLLAPNEPATHARIEEAILRALASWERRIDVEAVQITTDAADPEAAIATITYRLVATAVRERISVSIPVGAA